MSDDAKEIMQSIQNVEQGSQVKAILSQRSRSRKRQPLLINASHQRMEPLSRQWLKKIRESSYFQAKINEYVKAEEHFPLKRFRTGENQVQEHRSVLGHATKSLQVGKPPGINDFLNDFINPNYRPQALENNRSPPKEEKEKLFRRSTTLAVLNTLKQMNNNNKTRNADISNQRPLTSSPKKAERYNPSSFTSRARYMAAKASNQISDQDKYVQCRSIKSARKRPVMPKSVLNLYLKNSHNQGQLTSDTGTAVNETIRDSRTGQHVESTYSLKGQDSVTYDPYINQSMPLKIKVVCNVAKSKNKRNGGDKGFTNSLLHFI